MNVQKISRLKQMLNLSILVIASSLLFASLICSSVKIVGTALMVASSAVLLLHAVFFPHFVFDKYDFLVLGFGVSYCLGRLINGSFAIRDLFYFLLIPYQFFRLGRKAYPQHRIYLYAIPLAFALGSFLFGELNVIYTALITGADLAEGGIFITFPCGDFASRTALSIAILPLCGIAIWMLLMFPERAPAWVKWVGRCASVFVLVCALTWTALVSNRAGIVSIALTIAFAILVWATKLKRQGLRIAVYGFVGLCCVFCLMLTFGIVPDFLKGIPVFDRFLSGGSNSRRLLLYKEFFSTFYLHPFGGTFAHISDYYVHNFLFDIYNFGGAIPFVLFSILFFKSTWNLFCSSAKKPSDARNNLRTFLLMVLSSVVAIGLFEPIMQTQGGINMLFFLIIGFAIQKPSDPVELFPIIVE